MKLLHAMIVGSILVVCSFLSSLGFTQDIDNQNLASQGDDKKVDVEYHFFDIPVEYQQITKNEFDKILVSDGHRNFPINSPIIMHIVSTLPGL